MKTVWTIGHSTRSIGDFVAMLRSFDIAGLADIRSMPGSARYPHFNREVLSGLLSDAGIRYVHMPELGGKRKPTHVTGSAAGRNKIFTGFADYMDTGEFKEAIDKLEAIAMNERVAYMCAEAEWWRCHRSMISGYLKIKGWDVMHIMDMRKSEEHPDATPTGPMQGSLFGD